MADLKIFEAMMMGDVNRFGNILKHQKEEFGKISEEQKTEFYNHLAGSLYHENLAELLSIRDAMEDFIKNNQVNIDQFHKKSSMNLKNKNSESTKILS